MTVRAKSTQNVIIMSMCQQFYDSMPPDTLTYSAVRIFEILNRIE